MDLKTLGWKKFFADQIAPEETEFLPARVIEEQRGLVRVAGHEGESWAQVSGKLRFGISERSDLPAVGDWVLVKRGDADRAIIHRILERQTLFRRKIAGTEIDAQVIASNVDTAFIVTSLNLDLNLRRVERYLALVWEAGAQPVVVLTKADLCEDIDEKTLEVQAASPGVEVAAISALEKQGLDELARFLRPQTTAVVLGSSGVGKSTLINALLGSDRLATKEVRADDDRGKHTTTARQLLVLPSGALIIDTPGLRELQLWESDAGLSSTFQDIETLAEGCHFRDCSHGEEPGCRVQEAIANGELEAARFENFLKLKKEAAYLERRKDKELISEEKKKWKHVHKALKERNRNRTR